ncbi:MAG TPA: hypothetical protein VKE92_15230, partial [Anaerolineales bacterium]|nr:hypothetical protein [Anaerolineales bacterium]
LEISGKNLFKAPSTCQILTSPFNLVFALVLQACVTFPNWGRLAFVFTSMEIKSSTKLVPSYPSDRSLEAYKAWIRELSNRLTTNKPKINLTQQEWIASWKDYWNAPLNGFEK